MGVLSKKGVIRFLLDEIGDLAPGLQPRLLQAIEERRLRPH
jgi:transcriptional regulator with PAS, ATPase and Fis domain